MKRSNSSQNQLGRWVPLGKFFSPREREVCNLVAQRCTNREIARRLDLSERSVEVQSKGLIKKLGLQNREELIIFARKHGLMGAGPQGTIFKNCPSCDVTWSFRDQFLSDPEVVFLGYESTPRDGISCPLWFKHASCGARLALPLAAFAEVTGEPIFSDSCAVADKGKHCLAALQRTSCPLMCVCTYVGHITEIFRQWPKTRARP